MYNNYKGMYKDTEPPLLFLHLTYKYTRLNCQRKVIDVLLYYFMRIYSLQNFVSWTAFSF